MSHIHNQTSASLSIKEDLIEQNNTLEFETTDEKV